jgi:aminoglycoside phosphotransferase (APT) family kinase protein
MTEGMQTQLQTYCADIFPNSQDTRVGDLTSISAGWESDVYSFVLEHGRSDARQREELILRIYPGDDAYSKSAQEFHGMMQLHRAGYPVPRVLVLERETSPLERPSSSWRRSKGSCWGLYGQALPRRSRGSY